MRKLTKSLLTVSLAACVAGAVGCNANGSDAWKGTDFKNYGTVVAETNGGFVAETDNYVYFINGVGSSSSDNTFGTPIKGALVAADKKDAAKTPQVVVPELIVSTDYDAGIYLFNEGDKAYAYYGTPNREKNSSGAIASSEMTFTKTRLDGEENTKLFTVPSHSTTYRIAQGADGAVYIVYYDTENSAIVSYNAKTGKSTTIAKTDAKTNDIKDGEYLSLGEYKFLKNGNSAQVVYTMTVYTQKYVAEQEAQDNSYSRQTAAYNYMYLYTAGEEPVCIKDGSATDTTYAIKSNVDGYLFYTATSLFGGETNAKTYGISLNAPEDEKKIDYTDNIKDDMIIESFEKVYFYDSGKVVKTTLIKEPVPEKEAREYILKNDGISSLLAVDEVYVYCYDTDGYIVAIERAEDSKTIRVSERTASTAWYKPETAAIGDAEYMLFCDGSSEGNSYVFGADLNKLNAPETEDTDDDGETDVYYLESKFIGFMPAADRAAVVSAKINAIEKPLDLKEGDDGKYVAESVKSARTAYDNLDKDAKNNIASEDLKKLDNAEKAVALADAYSALEAVLNYDNLSQAEKDVLKTAYDTAKQLVESYGDDLSAIADYLTDNLNYFYQEAGSKLGATE